MGASNAGLGRNEVADTSLRYAELIGQEDAVARLRAFTELFASSGTTPGHILLIGDEGMGQSPLKPLRYPSANPFVIRV